MMFSTRPVTALAFGMAVAGGPALAQDRIGVVTITPKA